MIVESNISILMLGKLSICNFLDRFTELLRNALALDYRDNSVLATFWTAHWAFAEKLSIYNFLDCPLSFLQKALALD